MNRIELNREQFERLVCAWRDDATDPEAIKHYNPSPEDDDQISQLLPNGKFRRECEAILASRGLPAPGEVRYRLQLTNHPAQTYQSMEICGRQEVVAEMFPSTARYLVWG